MGSWLRWTLALAFVLAPFLLLVVFNAPDTADSRGRRHSRRWRC